MIRDGGIYVPDSVWRKGEERAKVMHGLSLKDGSWKLLQGTSPHIAVVKT